MIDEELLDGHAAWKEATVMASQGIDGKLKPELQWRMEVTDKLANRLFAVDIHAGAGPAGALVCFCGAVVAGLHPAMTPASGACVRGAFPTRASARLSAASWAHLEPLSVRR